jgi:hypothetical protein
MRRTSATLAVASLFIGLLAGIPAPPAAAATCVGSGGGPAPAAVTGGFHGISPIRLLDTRTAPPAARGPIPAGCTIAVDIGALGAAPADASAIALNVTEVGATGRGFVVVWPCGSPRPATSNLNARALAPTPNLVVTPLDATRRVCLFTSVRVDLVVDMTGWFAPGGVPFHEQTATRALDTRSAPRPDGGTGPLAAFVPLALPLTGSLTPLGSSAVAANITVVAGGVAGFAVAYPCGTAPPPTSTVNFLAGEIRANQTFVQLGSGGAMCLIANTPVHVVVDVWGWFGDGKAPIRFSARTGDRVVDSRTSLAWSGRIGVAETRSFASPVPDARTLVLNVVATEALGSGFLTLYPCGAPLPGTSSVNFAPGGETTNLVTVPVGDDGRVCVYSIAPTHVVIDLFGSFGAAGQLRDLSFGPLLLSPTFDGGVHDYAVRCSAGTNIFQIVAKGMPGTVVQVDGQGSAQQISIDVGVTPNEATVVTAGSDQYWIRCLPPDFPRLTIVPPRDPAPAWYLTASTFSSASFVVIFDERGTPVWYRRTGTPTIDARRLPDGNLAWMPFTRPVFNIDPTLGYQVRRLDGTLLDTIRAGAGLAADYHDLVSLPNGNHIVLAYDEAPRVAPLPFTCNDTQNQIDNVLQEVNPAGTVVWSWSSRTRVALDETTVQLCDQAPNNTTSPTGALDLIHTNSVSMAPDGSGDVIISARNLDAVLRIRRNPGGVDDGRILWKLGGTTPQSNATVHYTMTGDPLGSFLRQHDAALLANGHVMLFDNQSPPPPGRPQAPPRALEIALDPNTETASIVRTVPWPGAPVQSFGVGSARLQADGSVLVTWGGQSAPAFTEVDATGATVLTGTFSDNSFLYRVVKEPKASFDVAQLRATAGQ